MRLIKGHKYKIRYNPTDNSGTAYNGLAVYTEEYCADRDEYYFDLISDSGEIIESDCFFGKDDVIEDLGLYYPKEIILKAAKEIQKIDHLGYHSWESCDESARKRAIEQAKKCWEVFKSVD